MRLKSDLCLLKIPTKLAVYGRWGSGNLVLGEKVLVIGHPFDCVGSALIGHVAYTCTENVNFQYNDFQTCSKYISTSLEYNPEYRVMGHFWNDRYFEKDSDARTFEKNVQANLPVIQCTGLIGGIGSSGAPIFNSRGEIVGMLVSGVEGYELGIHVTALRQFYNVSVGLEKKLPAGGEGSSKEMNVQKRRRS